MPDTRRRSNYPDWLAWCFGAGAVVFAGGVLLLLGSFFAASKALPFCAGATIIVGLAAISVALHIAESRRESDHA